MKIKLIVFGVFLSLNISYAFLGRTERYSVKSFNAQGYHDMFGNEKSNIIPFGMPLTVTDRKGSKIRFRYKNQDLWIDEQYLTPLDFNKFSDNNSIFISTPVENDEDYWFVYQNMIYQMDLKDYTSPEIFKVARVPSLIDAVTSKDKKMWVLIGEHHRDALPIINIALFDMEQEKFHPLTSLLGEKSKIDSIEFSPNNKYVSFLLTLDEKNFLYIFDTKDRSLVYVQKDITGFTWARNELLIFSEKKTELFVNNEVKEKLATHSTRAIPRVVGTNLLVEIDADIYQYKNGELIQTDYKSLDRSPEGSFEQYVDRKGNLFTTYNGVIIRSMTGKTPPWTLLSYLDETRLLYTERQGAFQTVSIYDAENNISVPYRWIEETLGVLSNGVLIDAAIEEEEVWLFIESPHDSVVTLRLHDIL